MTAPSFVWFVHQPASAAWMKRELAERRPDLRFAFARPGLTTFKVEGGGEGGLHGSSFARASGWSLGRADDVPQILALADALPRGCRRPGMTDGLMPAPEPPRRLHVFERDPDRPADERDPAVAGTRARLLELELRAAAPDRFDLDPEARPGEIVLDVITAPTERLSDTIFVGWHRHGRAHGPWPGGVAHAAIPLAAPSRAWAKIEEAIRWSGLEPRPGETAIEIGSAPGGASYALLERGLEVHGIDPGAMAPSVLAYVGAAGNRFVHHAMPAAEVERRALPRELQWLAIDVNLAPMIALKYVERFVALGKGTLRGAFLTLKLNDDGVFAALPRLQGRIERLGAREVRYVQLPSHRSEIVAILAW